GSPAVVYVTSPGRASDRIRANAPAIRLTRRLRPRQVVRPFQGRRGEPAAFAPVALRRASPSLGSLVTERRRERLGLHPPASRHHHALASCFSTVWTSLSPRPDRFTSRIADGPSSPAIRCAYAMAWADSSAGRMPSSRASV